MEETQPAHVAAADEVLDGRQHHVGPGAEHALEDGVAEEADLGEGERVGVARAVQVDLDQRWVIAKKK